MINTLYLQAIICIVALFYIYKHRPIKWKQFIIIQMIACLVMYIISNQAYQFILNEIYTKAQSIQTDINQKAYSILYDDEESIELNLLNSHILMRNLDLYGDPNSGIMINVYDMNGELVNYIDSREPYLSVWNEENQMMIIHLKDLVDEKQIDSIIENMRTLNLNSNIRLQGIYGHIQDGKKVVEKIEFENFTIGKDSEEYDFVMNGWLNEFISVDNIGKDVDEALNGKIQYLNNHYPIEEMIKYPEKAQQMSEGNNKELYSFGVYPGNNYTVEYVVYTNAKAIALSSPKFQDNLKSTISSIESISMIIYCIFLSFQQKREKLELARNTFINAMAHEMKTPSAIIMNSVELIKMKQGEQDKYLDMIYEESNHMNDLLMRMLDYTRTSYGYKIKKEKIDLKEIVDTILARYQNDSIQVEVDMKDTIIEADRNLISIVIDNYIHNGFDHSHGQVVVSYQNHVFKVYNSGDLIPEEMLQSIWQPLYQVDESRHNENHSGMGLAISANCLKLLHYQYGLTQNDQGVTFYFKTNTK